MRKFLHRITEYIDAICGMPNYERYLAHMREQHPEVIPKERSAFFRDAVEHRYNGANRRTGRCC